MFSNTKLAQHGKFSQILRIWDLVASHIFMWHNNLFTFHKTFWQEVTKMELYWIYLSFVRKRAPLNIKTKLTNFVKLPNCVSLKSSKNSLSRQWEN